MTACKYDRDANEYLVDGEPCLRCVDRYWAKVCVGKPWECWDWEGTINSDGYGVLHLHNRQYRAHRLAYEVQRGPIPEGLVIDHLCRNRRCANPFHMEPVQNGENIRRGVSPWAINARRTHCVHGHEFTPENTRHDKGKRYCLECKRRSTRISERKRRAKAREAR